MNSAAVNAGIKLEEAYYKLLDAKHRLQEDDETSPLLKPLDDVLSLMSASMRALTSGHETQASNPEKTNS